MRVEVLGSGGAVTIPRPGCSCRVCVEAREKGVPYSRTGPSVFVHGPDVLIGDDGANSLFGHTGADTFIGKGGNDSIEAIDGQHDKLIDCGPGNDDASKDTSDPQPISC